MESGRLKETWDEIPKNGILPEDIKHRMWSNIHRSTTGRRKLRFKWMAAACTLLFFSLLGYQFLHNPLFSSEPAIVTKTYANDIRLLRLPDGTRIWVNQNTEIQYPEKFAANERIVTLKGEAFFEVQRDPLRPFIINSGKIKTTVLGTSFNIKAYTAEPLVEVRTGKVKVESNSNTVFLLRGDAAIYLPQIQGVKKQIAYHLEPEWKKTLLDIDGLTLEQVIEMLRKEHAFSVTYTNAQFKSRKIKGTLDARQGFPEMLQTIAFALELDIKPQGTNNYIINEIPD
jgi:ferric-dicitrate binding protein FerR (iron transport regulator)